MVPCATITAEGRAARDSRRLARATVGWSTVLLCGVEPVVSDPLDELAADPDVISGGGEDFSAFVMSRWPGLVRLAFGLTGDRWAAEDIAQATLARAFVAWRRVRRAGAPDAGPRASPLRRRVHGLLEVVEPPVAPVDAIVRRGRGIRLRRAAAAVGGLGLAGIIAAATLLTPPTGPAPQEPPLPVTVPASGIADPGG